MVDELDRQSVRIVIADDHAIVRRGLRLLLRRERDLEVVAEAGDTEAALRYLRGHHPEVLLLDLSMPGRSAVEAISAIRAQAPATRIVVLTMEDNPATARAALAAGAVGYVLKEASENELLHAVRLAAQGETYVSPRLRPHLAAASKATAADDLSERELGVLRLIGLGYTNVEIGEQLSISVRTVESHRARIQRKLRASTRSQLVRCALERGLLLERAVPGALRP